MDLMYFLSWTPAASDLALIALFAVLALITRFQLAAKPGKTSATASIAWELEMFLVCSGLFVIGFQLTWICARLTGRA